jgi:uncharacterized peroxidase-related enzyme
MTADEQSQLVASLTADEVESTHLTTTDRAMLGYAEKLTRTPASIRASDVDRLRTAGLDDRAIHDVCAIVAYFGFVNRIADGLGVELEQSAAPTQNRI